MKANIFRVLSLFSLLICFTGCGGGDDDPVKPSPAPEVIKPGINLPAQITTNGVTFSESKAGSQTISFTCDSDWTLSISETRSGTSWCTPSATSGTKGNVSITFTVTENTTYDDRSVTITIIAGSASVSFIISQKGKKTLLLTKDKYELDYLKNTIEIEVKANIDYQMVIAESAKNWIEEKASRGLTSYKHTLIIQKNEETDEREGEIYFKSNVKTDTVKVYQACEPMLILSKDAYTVSDTGETITVNVKSNIDFKIQLPNLNWVKQSTNTRALKETPISFIIEKNESSESRNTEIIFKNEAKQISKALNITQKGNPNIPVNTDNNITEWGDENGNIGNAEEE